MATKRPFTAPPGIKIPSTGTFLLDNTAASTGTTVGALVISGGVGIGGSLSIAGRIQLFNGNNYTSIVSTASTNTLYTLPNTAPSTGASVLQSDTSGNLSWVAMTATGVGGGSGLSSLNLLTSGEQYFAVGTTGSLFNISSLGSTHTFNIPIAGTGATGLVSTSAQSFAGAKTFTSDVIISSSTASTFMRNGALQVYGGVGISGQLSFNQASMGFTGILTNPSLAFIGTTGSPITLSVLTDNSLLFEGSSGQLFSIDNNLSTGEIFSVSDISGLPIISAYANQNVTVGEFGGNLGIGLSNPFYKLHVIGSVGFTSSTASTSTSTGTLVVSGGVGIGQSVSIGGRLQLFNSSNYTAFVSSASGNTVYTLPASTPATGSSVLQSTSAGVMSWVPMTVTASGSGTGLSNLNTLTDGIQYFSTGTSGSIFNISSSGSTHTFNIPIAGSASTGLITTSSQTIAGQKTFTSAIIGDLTGTATTAGFASTASYANQSGYAITSGSSSTANTATYSHQSGYAITSGSSAFASTASYSYTSGYGITAGLATTSTYSHQSGYAITSGSSSFASTASYSYQSGYGLTSGLATTAANINTVSSTSSDGNYIVFSPVDGGSGVALSTTSSIYVIPDIGYLTAPILDTQSITSTDGNITNFTGTAVTATNFYGPLAGNVTGTATTSRNVNIVSASTSASHPVLFTPATGTASGAALSTESTFVYNPSTDILSVSGLAITSGTASTSPTTGALTVAGGVGITGRLNVGIASTFFNTDSIAGFAGSRIGVFVDIQNTSTDDFAAAGLRLANNLYNSAGIFYFSSTTSPGFTQSLYISNSFGDTILQAGTGKAVYLRIGSNDLLTLNSTRVSIAQTTTSTSSTTGALTVTGGAGIAKTSYFGQDVKIQGTTGSASTTSGALVVSGGAGIAGSIFVGATISAADNIEIKSAKELRLNNSGNTFYTGLKAGSNASNTTYTLPVAFPSTGSSVLQSTSAGVMSWVPMTASGGLAISGSTDGTVQFKSGSSLGATNSLFFDTSLLGLRVSGFPGGSTPSSTDAALKVEQTVSSFNGSLNGTMIAVNANTGFAGDLMNLQVNAVSRFRIDSTGAIIQNIGTNSTSTTSGSVQVRGGVGITGAVYVGESVNATSLTQSTSTTSGSLVVSGGAGIAQSVSIGGRLQLFNSSNYTAFVSSASGNTVYTLPATSPATGSSVLQSTSAGVLSWVPMTAASSSGNTSQNIAINTAGNANTLHPVLVTPTSLSAGSAVSSDTTFLFNPSTEILYVSGMAVTSRSVSTSTSSGALVVNGGLGVSGQLTFATASFGFTGITSNPTMSFIGATSSSPITLTVLTDNSLSWEGSSGQVFAIDSNLSTGEIFAVSDISGIPIISASAGQTVAINEFGGFTKIGNGTLNSSSTSTGSLVIAGGLGMTGNANIGGSVIISNNTRASYGSTTSGALVVAGGVGIGGSVYIGGQLGIGGTLDYNASGNVSYFAASVNSYNQVIVHNHSNGNAASSDFVVSNDSATDTTFYGDFGMNSSGWAATTSAYNSANAVYLASHSGDLAIGTLTTNPIRFFYNNGTSDAVVFGGTAATVNYGTNSSSTTSGALQVKGGFGITGNAFIGGTTTVTDTTASTSSASGALVVSGGVGIGQTLFIGGNLYQNSNAITAYNTGFRNRIINGDFNIDQRNSGATVVPSATQNVTDRWKMNIFGAGRVTSGQNYGGVATPSPFVSYYGMKVTTTTTPGSSDYNFLSHVIEGPNINDLQWGNANAQTVTLSFWAYSSLTGTFGGSVRNFGGFNRSYPFTYTISSANTWEKKTVVIPGDTTGTWTVSTATGIELIFVIANGSGFQSAPGAWAAGNFHGPTGSLANLIGTLNSTLYITGVQIELGTVATPFEKRNYGHEFSLCQRYYQITEVRVGGYHTTGGGLRGSAYLNTAMRPIASPVLTVLATDESSNLGSLNVDTSNFRGDSYRYIVSVTTTGDAYGQWKVSADCEF